MQRSSVISDRCFYFIFFSIEEDRLSTVILQGYYLLHIFFKNNNLIIKLFKKDFCEMQCSLTLNLIFLNLIVRD